MMYPVHKVNLPKTSLTIHRYIKLHRKHKLVPSAVTNLRSKARLHRQRQVLSISLCFASSQYVVTGRAGGPTGAVPAVDIRGAS